MGQSTKIQWTEASWNPVRGCSRVSAGCDNCYAMHVAHRFSGEGQPYEGLTVIRQGNTDWSGKIKLVEEHLLDPLRWKKSRRIFVNSMSDLFHHNVPDEFIDKVFAVMALCPQHTFQILTKRPERMLGYLSNNSSHGNPRVSCIEAEAERLPNDRPNRHLRIDYNWPLPNVWLGVSVENQATADERIPILLRTPAAVRWISAEPLLEALDLTEHLFAGADGEEYTCKKCGEEFDTCTMDHNGRHAYCGGEGDPQGLIRSESEIDWIVVGGESGSGARPFNIEWARQLITQCKEADVPIFVKQLGAKPYHEEIIFDTERGIDGHPKRFNLDYIIGKGGDPEEWPEDLRVREYPTLQSV